MTAGTGSWLMALQLHTWSREQQVGWGHTTSKPAPYDICLPARLHLLKAQHPSQIVPSLRVKMFKIHEPVGGISNSNQSSLGMNLTRSWKASIIKPQNTGEYENKTVEMEEGTSPLAHGSAGLCENGHIAKVFWCLHKNPNGYSSCQ